MQTFTESAGTDAPAKPAKIFGNHDRPRTQIRDRDVSGRGCPVVCGGDEGIDGPWTRRHAAYCGIDGYAGTASGTTGQPRPWTSSRQITVYLALTGMSLFDDSVGASVPENPRRTVISANATIHSPDTSFG